MSVDCYCKFNRNCLFVDKKGFTMVNNSKVDKLFTHKIISIEQESNYNSLRLVGRERPPYPVITRSRPTGEFCRVTVTT